MSHKSILSMGVYVLGAAVFISESALFVGGSVLANSSSLSKADGQVQDQAPVVELTPADRTQE